MNLRAKPFECSSSAVFLIKYLQSDNGLTCAEFHTFYQCLIQDCCLLQFIVLIKVIINQFCKCFHSGI